MITNKYDVEAYPSIVTTPAVSDYEESVSSGVQVVTSPSKSGQQSVAAITGAPFQPMSSVGLRAATTKARAPYVFEHCFPSDRLLDPADCSPNVYLLFESHLSEVQQKRLLRKMEREERLTQHSRLSAEVIRRRKDEEERLSRLRRDASSELERLEQKYHTLTSRLETIVHDRKEHLEEEEAKEVERKEQQKSRELYGVRSGKKWALFEAIHGHDATTSAVPSTSLYSEQQSPSPSRGVSPEHVGCDSCCAQGEDSSPSHALSQGAQSSSPVASVEISKAQSRSTSGKRSANLSSSSVATPPRFERLSTKSQRLKQLFDRLDEEDDQYQYSSATTPPRGGETTVPVTPPGSGRRQVLVSSQRRGQPPPGVAARAAPRPRVIVDL